MESAPQLRLEDYETPQSRYCVVQLPSIDLEAIKRSGTIHFGRTYRERHRWEHLLTGDLLVAIVLGAKQFLIACQVRGKSVGGVTSSHSRERPFILHVTVLGYTDGFRLKYESFFLTEQDVSVPRALAKDLWEQCRSVRLADAPAYSRQVIESGAYTVRLAEEAADYDFIARIASQHPFGLRRAFLTLICERNGQRCGALLAELGEDLKGHHRAVRIIFRSELLRVMRHAVSIVRLYEVQGSGNKMRIHEVLIRALLMYAPAIVDGSLTMVEGVSYDYHPVALRLGFHVFPPRRIEDSFYYWLPFDVPEFSQTMWNPDALVRRVREIRESRHAIRYWLAPGRSSDITRGLQFGAWAVRHQNSNVGRWRSLSKGSVIFLLAEQNVIEGYAIVSRTEKRDSSLARGFPLWIDFEPGRYFGVAIDIADHLTDDWFQETRFAGLVPVPGEFGAQLALVAENQLRRGAMWVNPNPYLLHRREFDTVPGQVFVVQAWELRDKVLPVIRGVLQEYGFSAKYAGDREGQLVFEDIWKFLNESEVVLVDFTHRRPNVYLEYGMALVLGKPIVAITQSKDDLPSDTPNLKYILYVNELGDKALSEKLPRAIRDVMDDIHYMKSRGV